MARPKKKKTSDKRSHTPEERDYLDQHKAHMQKLAAGGHVDKIEKIHADLQKGRPAGVKHTVHFSARVMTAAALKKAKEVKEKQTAERGLASMPKEKEEWAAPIPASRIRPKPPSAKPPPKPGHSGDANKDVDYIYQSAFTRKYHDIKLAHSMGQDKHIDAEKVAHSHAEREVRNHVKRQKVKQKYADKLSGKKTGFFSKLRQKVGL